MKYGIKKKILAIVLLILLFFPTIEYAAEEPTTISSKEAGQKVANFAISFVTNHASECVYDVSDAAYNHCLKKNAQGKVYKRVAKDTNNNGVIDENEMFVPMDYTGELVYSARYNNKYPFDCTGFVSFLYNQALGILSASNMVTTNGGNTGGGYFDILDASVELQPGDILRKPLNSSGTGGHVSLYVGLGGGRDIVEAASVRSGIRFSSLPQYTQVLRLKDGTEYEEGTGGLGETLPEDEEVAGSDVTLEGGVNQYIDPYDPSVSIPDPDSFEFPGLAEENFVGMGDRIEDLKKGLEAIVDFLSDAFTWIVGIILYPIKMVLIGWIQIAQNAITSIFSAATGTEITEINIEDIIFNKIQLLDVNVFTNTPGGMAISSGSVVGIIHEGIRTWYYTFRNVGIAGMLITLLYLGIRMALSTVPEGKAKYKQMLIGWIYGFAIVFFVHYFILIVITFNESLLQILPKETELGTTIFQEIEAGMYQIDFVDSMLYIVVFLILLYYTIRFLFVYLKRYLTVMILIMMAPLMGIVYSIDRINGNKTSGHFTIWLQEFTINVLIQFVHAVIYVVFVATVLQMIQQAASIATMIIVFIMLKFMLEAEVLVKRMFKLNKATNSLKDIKDATKGWEIATKAVFTGTVAKAIGSASVAGAKKVGGLLVKPFKANANDSRGRENTTQEGSRTQGRTLTNIDEKIEQERNNKDKSRAEIGKQLGKFALNATSGGALVVGSIPLIILSPAKGIFTFTMGMKRLKAAYGSGTKIPYPKRNIKGPILIPRRKVWYFVRGKFSTNFFRGIAPNALTKAYSEYKNSPEKVKNMQQARNIEMKLAIGIDTLKEQQLIVKLPKKNMFGETTGGDSTATKEQIKATKEFNKEIKNLLEGTSRKNVEKAVSNYFLTKTVHNIQFKNVDEIAQNLEHIKVSEEFGANFKETLKLEIMNAALSSNELSDDKTRIKIDKKLKKEIKQTAKQARLHFKEVRDPSLPKEENKVKENEQIYEALDKKIDDNTMGKVLEKMSVEDLTRVMHKTILQQDSIQKTNVRPEFAPVLLHLQELHELNEETRYNTGEAIYNIDDLVKQMKEELTKKDVLER